MIRRAGVVMAVALIGIVTTGCFSCPLALARGVVVAEGDTLVLAGRDGGTARVAWPDGYRVERRGDELVLVDLFGTVKAREGDEIQMGGGSGADGVFKGCGDVTIVDAAPTPQEA